MLHRRCLSHSTYLRPLIYSLSRSYNAPVTSRISNITKWFPNDFNVPQKKIVSTQIEETLLKHINNGTLQNLNHKLPNRILIDVSKKIIEDLIRSGEFGKVVYILKNIKPLNTQLLVHSIDILCRIQFDLPTKTLFEILNLLMKNEVDIESNKISNWLINLLRNNYIEEAESLFEMIPFHCKTRHHYMLLVAAYIHTNQIDYALNMWERLKKEKSLEIGCYTFFIKYLFLYNFEEQAKQMIKEVENDPTIKPNNMYYSTLLTCLPLNESKEMYLNLFRSGVIPTNWAYENLLDKLVEANDDECIQMYHDYVSTSSPSYTTLLLLFRHFLKNSNFELCRNIHIHFMNMNKLPPTSFYHELLKKCFEMGRTEDAIEIYNELIGGMKKMEVKKDLKMIRNLMSKYLGEKSFLTK